MNWNSREGKGFEGKGKFERKRGRLKGKEELRKGQGRKVEGECKRKVERERGTTEGTGKESRRGM